MGVLKTDVTHPSEGREIPGGTVILAGWAKVRRKLKLEGESLVRPPRGFDPNHRFIEEIKRKDFVASVGLT